MPPISVCVNRKSEWTITNVSNASTVCRFAVEELQRYLKLISGCDLQIQEKHHGESVFIVGLRQDVTQDSKQSLPPQAEGFDGYAVSVGERNIVVAGDNERGVVYGVYDLLEKLGCRWFYPMQDPKDREVVPTLDVVAFEPGAWSVASPIPIRLCNATSFFFEIVPEIMRTQLDVAMKSRYNGMAWQCDHRSYVGDQYREMDQAGIIDEIKKRGMLFHGPAHSFQHFLRDDDYFDDHPEWFGMRDGKRVHQVFGGSQFCWSNPEARRQFVLNAERFVLDSPALDIFCTLGFDGGPACDCPECQKSTPADLVFVLLGELCDRLRESAPHVMVETSGGYNPVHEPPKAIVPPENLRVVWAHWGRNYSTGYDDPEYCWKDNLELWRKSVKNRLTLCQYYTDNFASPWIAAPYTIAMESDRRYVLKSGIDGIYMLMWAKGYWWNHGLNHHLAGRCFYDISSDLTELIHDYALHYFGPDAGALLSEYYQQWAREIELCYRVKDNSRPQDRDMLADQRKQWIDPAVQAVKDDPLLSHRVGKVATLHGAAEKLTQAHAMRDEIERLRASGDFDGALRVLQAARVFTDEVIQHMAWVASLDQGLVDAGEVPNFITKNIKGWLNTEQEAIEKRHQGSARGSEPIPDSMTTLPAAVLEQN